MHVGRALVPAVFALSCSGTTIDRIRTTDPSNHDDAGASGGSSTGGARSVVEAGPGPVRDAFVPVSRDASIDAGICASLDVFIDPLPADVFLVLDASSEMGAAIPGGTMTWWDAVRGGISEFIRSPLASGYSLGVQYFPLAPPAADVCQADYGALDVDIGPLPDNAQRVEESLARRTLAPGRPTGPALSGALAHMTSRPFDATIGRMPEVILITSGDPTACKPALPNELKALVDAADSGTPRVINYVIGLGANASDLVALGAGPPEFFAIPGGDVERAIRLALYLSIRGTNSLLDCSFDVPITIDGPAVDLDRVDVSIVPDPFGVARETLPRVASAADCERHGNQGFYYDGDDAHPKLMLCRDSCVLAMDTIHIKFGCNR